MRFFKIFFAALLACIVASVLSIALCFAITVGLIYAFNTTSSQTLKPNSVLVIDLKEPIVDSPTPSLLSSFDINTYSVKSSLSLLNALALIEIAAEDSNIEGIVISPSLSAQVCAANLEELRAAIERFKSSSGKFVVAYADYYTQGGYYLASVADEVYLCPEGIIDWSGVASSSLYYKGTLDKLGIKVEAIRPEKCRYKSAVEPYILKSMSSENREQMQELVDSYWSSISSEVAQSRGLSHSNMEELTNRLDGFFAQQALRSGLVDGLIYRDGLKGVYAELGVESSKGDEYRTITLGEYASIHLQTESYNDNNIAIIYAEGAIYQGSSISDGLYSDALISLIRRAKRDQSVKAVVLRVNSPGGDALAADVMCRELELLREVKPMIVSMGSAAASGGYYIAAPADVIVADKTTITGSIGVFGLVPYLAGALESKLGITSSVVKSNTMANFASPLEPLSSSERRVLQHRVDQVYDQFTSIVSQGRNLPLERVEQIAQGRVWTGEQALEIGLVDAIGGLHEAVAIAANKAGIVNDFSIKEITHTPKGLEALLSFAQMQISSIVKSREQSELKMLYRDYEQAQRAIAPIFTEHGLVMFSPYVIDL